MQISWGTGGVVSTDTESFRRSSSLFTPSDRGVNLGLLLFDLNRAATAGLLLLLPQALCMVRLRQLVCPRELGEKEVPCLYF